jgi:hypothetical protein
VKFTVRDLKKLRWQLAIAAGLVVAAAAIAYMSLIALRKAEAEHRAVASSHARIDTRLRQVRTEEEDIKNRAALFLHLQERGIIGEEKRLDWIEMVDDLQNRMRLPDMNYEFAPQKPLEGDGSGEHAFFVSSMKLHLNLVHEEDLLDFLAEVQREARAVVLARSCNVSRAPAGARNSLAQLSADCELDWITVRKAEIAKR